MKVKGGSGWQGWGGALGVTGQAGIQSGVLPGSGENLMKAMSCLSSLLSPPRVT